MKTRIVIVGIIIEDKESVALVSEILHQYGNYIIGKMGLSYGKKQVNIISVVIDAPGDTISALSGKLGNIRSVSAKALHSKA